MKQLTKDKMKLWTGVACLNVGFLSSVDVVYEIIETSRMEAVAEAFEDNGLTDQAIGWEMKIEEAQDARVQNIRRTMVAIGGSALLISSAFRGGARDEASIDSSTGYPGEVWNRYG